MLSNSARERPRSYDELGKEGGEVVVDAGLMQG